MMFIIQIGCDGDAFRDTEENDPVTSAYRRRAEVARILQVAAVRIGAHGEQDGTLQDFRGENVGTFVFTEDD
jgi:hypothetical protein